MLAVRLREKAVTSPHEHAAPQPGDLLYDGTVAHVNGSLRPALRSWISRSVNLVPATKPVPGRRPETLALARPKVLGDARVALGEVVDQIGWMKGTCAFIPWARSMASPHSFRNQPSSRSAACRETKGRNSPQSRTTVRI